MKKVMKISDLETVRLLTDPLKVQLLQAFVEEPRSTKAAAKLLGERVTKLYRHVDALHAAGLLEVVSEQQKRGTVERTFQAVAGRFEIDQSLFAGDEADEMTAAIRDLLRAGEREILEALDAAREDIEDHAVMMRLRIKASPERMAELRQLLHDWIELADTDETPGENAEEAGALIAFYPLQSH